MRQQVACILTLFLLLMVCWSWTVQKNTNTDFSYSDAYGNKITIENIQNLPDPLDTNFFKSNLNSSDFNKKLSETTLRCDIIIVAIRTIKKKKKFELRITTVPKTKDIQEILKYQGCSLYRMIIKKINNNLKIERLDFLQAEI